MCKLFSFKSKKGMSEKDMKEQENVNTPNQAEEAGNVNSQAENQETPCAEEQLKESRKEKKKKQDKHEEEIKELKEKLSESNDKFLRLYSEFDNYRKRTSKERLDLLKTASEEMIVAMLPVLDDFERAMKSMEADENSRHFREGTELIYNKFKSLLEQKGLKKMESINQDFNPDIHEAIAQIPAPDENSKGKVIDEVEKGYCLHEKVIRFAKVVVAQ